MIYIISQSYHAFRNSSSKINQLTFSQKWLPESAVKLLNVLWIYQNDFINMNLSKSNVVAYFNFHDA